MHERGMEMQERGVEWKRKKKKENVSSGDGKTFTDFLFFLCSQVFWFYPKVFSSIRDVNVFLMSLWNYLCFHIEKTNNSIFHKMNSVLNLEMIYFSIIYYNIVIQNVAYDNFDNFQDGNSTFSKEINSLFWTLFNDETNIRERYGIFCVLNPNI